ncbi:MAG: hypothetical protein E6I61_03585 [Chloroflexi bacterium]|nr:MAG: hypothetical protein E6I71_04720 [Chloroflexota bacterium]TME42168.1 MAG: hypothetical protein E6I61_03585 [Chloroflexota bacterium]TME52383.1 MAG: hypothetical protein E6I53_06715 [Chloroflexota bacterium]
MHYWELVTRSFRIAWDHKYLWLIGLFSGEAGGSSFNYSQRSTGTTQTPAQFQQQVSTWLSDHLGLIIFLAVVWLVLIVAFFILAAICEGATVRASAEHDAERPFGLGMAWRAGLHTMWVIVRFRLLLLALYLPLLILFVIWLVGLVSAIANENRGATPVLVLAGLLLLVVWFVYAIYLFFLDRFGSRALVLEQLMARASIARAHRLLLKRFGRSLLVLLLAIGVAIVLGIALACVSLIVVVPFVAGAFAAGSNSGAAVVVLVIGVLILLPVYLVVAGFLAAQGSTYWTLAFRRLDFDHAPAYAYPTAPYPPASPAPPAPQP